MGKYSQRQPLLGKSLGSIFLGSELSTVLGKLCCNELIIAMSEEWYNE